MIPGSLRDCCYASSPRRTSPPLSVLLFPPLRLGFPPLFARFFRGGSLLGQCVERPSKLGYGVPPAGVDPLGPVEVHHLLDRLPGTENHPFGEKPQTLEQSPGGGESLLASRLEDLVRDGPLALRLRTATQVVDRRLVLPQGLSGGSSQEALQGLEPAVQARLPQEQRGVLVELRPQDKPGPDRVQLRVDHRQKQRAVGEKQGAVEALPPEVAPVVGPLVVPEGVAPLDVTHQLGEVEEAVAVENLRSAAKLLPIHFPESLEGEDSVPVVAHDGQGVDLAEVGGRVTLDHPQKLAAEGLDVKGTLTLQAGGTAGDEVEALLPLGLDSSHSGHGVPPPFPQRE